ncbi:hypothetical protein HAX54_043144 [Datura stramonium]|uniref:Uncharacterized protein n=1 Tax=Datura stramonium TaxID=4076 RepID=A0ABS8SMR0_DATST|nr:hypothetical protein [Datura stramonium]
MSMRNANEPRAIVNYLDPSNGNSKVRKYPKSSSTYITFISHRTTAASATTTSSLRSSSLMAAAVQPDQPGLDGRDEPRMGKTYLCLRHPKNALDAIQQTQSFATSTTIVSLSLDTFKRLVKWQRIRLCTTTEGMMVNANNNLLGVSRKPGVGVSLSSGNLEHWRMQQQFPNFLGGFDPIVRFFCKLIITTRFKAVFMRQYNTLVVRVRVRLAGRKSRNFNAKSDGFSEDGRQ